MSSWQDLYWSLARRAIGLYRWAVNSRIGSRFDKISLIIALLAVGFLGIVALANLAGFEQGVIGYAAHFLLHCGVAALALGAWLIRQFKKCAALALVLSAGYLVQVGWLWWPPQMSTSKPEGSPIRVLSFNVYQANQQYSRVIAALREANPDVMYLTEVTPAWHHAITPLRAEWPHGIGEGSNVLLSRFPLENGRSEMVTFEQAKSASGDAEEVILTLTEDLRRDWIPTEILVATARRGDQRLNLVGLHMPTPRSRVSLIVQKACGLVAAREFSVARSSQASVLLGDLNTSSFSPTFRFLITHTQLRNSAQGFGYSPTWGPRLPKEPWLPWLGTAIDHVLISENVTVTKWEVGPALGSDHRWVMAEIMW